MPLLTDMQEARDPRRPAVSPQWAVFSQFLQIRKLTLATATGQLPVLLLGMRKQDADPGGSTFKPVFLCPAAE